VLHHINLKRNKDRFNNCTNKGTELRRIVTVITTIIKKNLLYIHISESTGEKVPWR
jgi:hypothetical protein